MPILIVGAGPVGLVTAIALKRCGHEPLVIDARPRGAGFDDPRALALSHGSRLIFERLDLWRRLAATPVRHIEVSQEGGFGRTHIAATDHRIDALGHVVRAGSLAVALLDAALAIGVEMRFDSALGAVTPDGDALVTAVGDTTLAASLLIRAEGTPGREIASVKDYGQTAIVSEAWSEQPHLHRAYERFTRDGPLALLPLDAGFSIVWCMAPERAAALERLSTGEFSDMLQEATRFAPFRWTRVAERRSYQLALTRRDVRDAPREIALGNAAQSLHPVAGQGLNLGLRDAFELSLALRDGVSAPILEAWRRRRRADRDAMVATTDRYVSLFSNDFAPLRAARGAGLALLDLLPPLRAQVARHMMFGVR